MLTYRATDVSGLLGHLDELLAEHSLQITLIPEAIPLLPGALAQQKDEQLIAAAKRDACSPSLAQLEHSELWPMLLDPQTSGGLLAAIAPEHADEARTQGFAVIGSVVDRPQGSR